MVALIVYYHNPSQQQDQQARYLAGKRETASANYPPNKFRKDTVRELNFQFHSEEEMEVAKQNLLNAGFSLFP